MYDLMDKFVDRVSLRICESQIHLTEQYEYHNKTISELTEIQGRQSERSFITLYHN